MVMLSPEGALARDVPLADWSRVVGMYDQCIAVLEDPEPYLPDVLPAFLAELISRLSASYIGNYTRFMEDARTCLSPGLGWFDLYMDERFSKVTQYKSVPRVRRRPVPFEAIVETGRRLRDIERIERLLAAHSVGAVVGGSMSYGRFFNVVGWRDNRSSDIDLLLIIYSWDKLSVIIRELGKLPGIDPSSIETMARRAELVAGHINDDLLSSIFSQKLRMWQGPEVPSDPDLKDTRVDGRYDISVHVISLHGARELTLFNRAKIELLDEEMTRGFKFTDYRETEVAATDHQRSFNGQNLRIAVPSYDRDGFFVRETNVFAIQDGRFYPGMLMNLILPQFEIAWGSRDLRKMLESLRWKLIERLRHERILKPQELMRLSMSHTRSHVFAPHIVRSVDGSTQLS